MRLLLLLAGVAALFGSSGPAGAQVVIEEIRAQFFLEHSGRLSENIVGTERGFFNVVIGGSVDEPASSVLVTLAFIGPDKISSPDRAGRDPARVTVRQKTKTGERLLFRRDYAGFLLGEDGRAYKTFLLENATCLPLVIDVRAGRSTKTATLNFHCGE
jgi:hypothetical protein